NLLRCHWPAIPPGLRDGDRRALRMTPAQGLLTGGLLVAMMGYDASALGADRARDESDIRQLQARQQDAWNRHDAKAYAALFTDDGDVVNVVGWWWKGRREIERQLTAAYAVAFRESRLTTADVEVR